MLNTSISNASNFIIGPVLMIYLNVKISSKATKAMLKITFRIYLLLFMLNHFFWIDPTIIVLS